MPLPSLPSLLLLPPTPNPLPYALAKHAFHTPNPGSSLAHIYALSLPALSSLVLYYSYPSRPGGNDVGQLGVRQGRAWTRFAHEFVLLVLPLLLGLTVCEPRWWQYNTALLIRAAWVRYSTSSSAILSAGGASDPKADAAPAARAGTQVDADPNGPRTHYPPLTTYRAHLNLLTTISILAVDFPVFPRRLGKTTGFGWSMMDLGVGSFVLSAGLSSSRSLQRPQSLSKTVQRQLPLLLLALVRVVAVKTTDYPEQAEEYGTHWNFFATLFLLPIMAWPGRWVLRRVAGSARGRAWVGLGMGMACTAVHQAALDRTGWGAWALGEDRRGLVGANKEGLTSLPGYLALYMFGIALGQLLPLTASPTAGTGTGIGAETYQAGTGAGKVVRGLLPMLGVVWAAFALASWAEVGGGPCRRLANVQYVLHTAAYNLLFMMFYVILDGWYFPTSPTTAPTPTPTPAITGASPSPSPSKPSSLTRTPPLFHALNAHPLALFLLANLLTGLVNLALPTMYVRDAPAMGVLGVYLAVVCAVAWAWR